MTLLASLALASAAFVGSHFAMSHPLRAGMVARLGERGFLGVYSLVSFATLGWMVHAFRPAHAGAPYLWDPGNAGWIVGTLLLWLGTILFVGSLRRNPSFPTGGAAVTHIGDPTGVFRITRHPMLWGFLLWAVTHTIVAPTPPGLVLVAAIGVLSLGGMLAQDAKKERLVGAPWKEWEARTSLIPFARGLASPGAFALIGGTVLFLFATFAHGAIGAGPWRWLG
jgi:uncharacterized membrane protein